MLILILALLVGTYAVAVARRVSAERRSVRHRQALSTLESAIDAARRAGSSEEQAIRFPLDERDERWVTVEIVDAPESGRRYRATLVHDNRAGMFITRPMTSP